MKEFKKIRLLLAVVMASVSVGAVIPAVYAADDGITTVVCVGDSLTEGQDADTAYSNNPTYEYAYPKQLQELFDEEVPGEYSVGNYGVGGATLCVGGSGYKGLAKFHESLSKSDVEYVVIMLGTNDRSRFGDEAQQKIFKDEYLDLIDIYRSKYRKAKYILISPPPLNTSESGKGDATLDGQYRDVASVIVKEIAAETGCDYVDGYQLVKNSVQFEDYGFGIYYDSVHYRPDGYSIFAEKIYDMIKADEAEINVTADYTSDGAVSLISDAPITGAKIYVASYNSENRLEKATSFDVSNIEAYKAYIQSVNSGFNKAFIWKNDGGMTPIADAADIGNRFAQNGAEVTISGKTFAGATLPHAICVKATDGSVVYAGQVKTKADGSFTHKFTMPESAQGGAYTVLSSSFGTVISETINYIK